MKALRPPQMTVTNENCNNLNNNLSSDRTASNSIVGIVDVSATLSQVNPTLVQQQTNCHQVTRMHVSTPPEHFHKSPASISTGSASTVSCGSCLQPICDRYIMKVVENSYHEKCLNCFICCGNLMNTCFQRDNKLYCRIDYER